MVFQLMLLFTLLFLIFFFTSKISTYVFKLVNFLFQSKSIALWLVHLLFLHGTIIHEVSHFLVAKILQVPTGELSIIPKIEDGRARTGSLEIGATDPVRLTLVGLAPLFVGLILIYTIGAYFFPNFLFFETNNQRFTINNFQLVTNNRLLTAVIGFYLLLSVSSTMFSSKKDLKPLIFVIPLFILLAATFYIIGVRIAFTQKFLQWLNFILNNLNRYLLLASLLNGVIYAIFRGGLSIVRKLKKPVV